MRDPDGRLLRTYKDGRASLNAYLEDHAFLAEALLVLYEATLRDALVRRGARDSPTTSMRALSRARADGGFFDTASDHEDLVVRPEGLRGPSDPVGQLVRGVRRCCASAAFTGERAYERPRGRGASACCTRPPPAPAGLRPSAPGDALPLLAPREVALVGEPLEELAAVVRRRFRPTVVLAGMHPGDDEAPEAVPLLRGREPVGGRPPRTSARTSRATCR